MANTAPWTLGDLHHLGLTVRDLEQSVRFYRDVLGMTLVRRRETDADHIGQQTGFPGVKLAVASFKPNPTSRQSLEVVQYLRCEFDARHDLRQGTSFRAAGFRTFRPAARACR